MCHSKNGLQPELIRHDATVDADAQNQSLMLSVNRPLCHSRSHQLLSSANEVWGKVIFFNVAALSSGCLPQKGVPSLVGVRSLAGVPSLVGMPSLGGSILRQRMAHPFPRMVPLLQDDSGWQPHGWQKNVPPYGQQADGMHPTGMLSSYRMIFILAALNVNVHTYLSWHSSIILQILMLFPDHSRF